MRYLMICLWVLACSTQEEKDTPTPVTFEGVDFITLTNENTNGGSQIAYHLSGISPESLIFCFCQDSCSREFVVVAALEFNADTANFRYKISLKDNFQTASTTDWCTRYN
jgi:hypothetical protein